MQEKFDLTEPWYLTWAVVGGEIMFGGAAVCYLGNVTQIDSLQWANTFVKSLKSPASSGASVASSSNSPAHQDHSKNAQAEPDTYQQSINEGDKNVEKN